MEGIASFPVSHTNSFHHLKNEEGIIPLSVLVIVWLATISHNCHSMLSGANHAIEGLVRTLIRQVESGAGNYHGNSPS